MDIPSESVPASGCAQTPSSALPENVSSTFCATFSKNAPTDTPSPPIHESCSSAIRVVISLPLLLLLHLRLFVVLDAQVHVHRERIQCILVGLALLHRLLEQSLRVVG